MYERGFVASNDGNISCRIEEDRILTTPTGMSKGFLKLEDLCIVDMDGALVSGQRRPSSEIGMHIFLYCQRPDVRAVVHAHPPTATGFAVAGVPLTACVLPEVVITLGAIPIAEYGTPGGPEISEPIRQYVMDYDAYLLENHGATTIGADVMNAYYKMETLEHFAKILFVAKQLGGYNELDAEQVAKLGRHPRPHGPARPRIRPAIFRTRRQRNPHLTNAIPTIRTLSAGGSPPDQTPQADLVAEITRRVMAELKTGDAR